MDIALFCPFVRYIDKRTYIPEYSEEVFAYDHRMFFVLKGSVQVLVSGKSYILTENKALIIPPAAAYKLKPISEIEYFIVNFDFIYKNTAPEPLAPVTKDKFEKNKIFDSSTSKVFPVLLSCQGEAAFEAEEIFDAYIKKPVMYREFMSCGLKRFVTNALIYTKQDKTPKLAADIISYINQNFSRNLTNISIAKKFSYHPNYINRIFKKSTGKTIKTYVTELRLKNAKRLLKTTNFNINKISELCGFESYSYFIKIFRTSQGISPLKYRKQNSRIL